MRYRYLAMTIEGKRLHGEMHTESQAQLQTELAFQALTLLRARPVRASRRKEAGWRARADFCFHLAQLLAAGIPLLEALELLVEALPAGSLTDALPDVLMRIRRGASFSAALQSNPRCFGALMVCGVQAGETSGRLVEVLQDLKDSFLWRDDMGRRTRKALYYPAFAGAVMLVATVFLLTSVVPQVREFVTDAGGTLPWSTSVLLAVSDGLVRFGIWVALGLSGLAAMVLFTMRYSSVFALQLDRTLLHLPVVGLILRHAALSQYARHLAMLYDAGVPLLQALDIACQTLSRPGLAVAFKQVRPRVEAGATLSQAFASLDMVPPLLMAMLRTGEATGRLGETLRQAARYYQREVEDRAQRVQTLIEPILTLVLGGLLAWIMLAVLGPVFDNLGRMR
ncbi:type II secretion system F family protein [Silvimonas amylolytica]|uniref:Phytochrome sensor protein n=1 Tax=Silvimonas amylolytica TaxID=449663 RepID=A0ABQ2PQ86_9NEIS|nr:type II secretion system F family protein [Silvimonas amylolytica]GGP27792.1 phytochrome sensor protein [Silvimonas amylolytica]